MAAKTVRLMEELNIESFHEYMDEYRKQLENGAIQEADRGLMEYFNALRLYFKKKFPDHSVCNSVYYGCTRYKNYVESEKTKLIL